MLVARMVRVVRRMRWREFIVVGVLVLLDDGVENVGAEGFGLFL